MIDELQIFRGNNYKINEHINIRQPTLNDICNYGEQRYYSMVSNLCATPSDCKVQLLDSFGIDYEEVDDFVFFCMLFKMYSANETSIIFGDLDFQKLNVLENLQTNEFVLIDNRKNIVIDKSIYTILTDYIRHLHGFKKNVEIAGNAHTKQYLMDKERRRLKHSTKENNESMLLPLISAMVNCEQFKYNHETVWDLPIYVFMDSVKRIQKLQSYNQVMQGAYAGTIDLKTISQDSLNWMGRLGDS